MQLQSFDPEQPMDYAMPPVTIYTTSWCPYCQSAKALLSKKGVAFEEIDVEAKPDQRQAMIARAGGRTSVPQIFIGERHVGGSDDIHALDSRGQLDALLAG
jgi:glutaredoxin 3